MILEALNVYYDLAVSKRDLKPFLKTEKCSSWFCRLLFLSKIAPGGPNTPWNLCFVFRIPPEGPNNTMKLMFFSKNPPEGQLNHETSVTNVSTSQLSTLLTPWNLHIFWKRSPLRLSLVWTLERRRTTKKLTNKQTSRNHKKQERPLCSYLHASCLVEFHEIQKFWNSIRHSRTCRSSCHSREHH